MDAEPLRDGSRRIAGRAELGAKARRRVGEQSQHGHGVDRARKTRSARILEREPCGLGDEIERRAADFDRGRRIRNVAAADKDGQSIVSRPVHH
jgi:hypothetical protein